MENLSTTTAAAATTARTTAAAVTYAASLLLPALSTLPPRPSQGMLSLAGLVVVRYTTLRPRPYNLDYPAYQPKEEFTTH